MRISLLPRGAVLAGVSVALLAGGLIRVDGPMATLGLTLAALLALAATMAWLNGIAIQVALQGPSKVDARQPFPIAVMISNKHRFLDAGGLRVTLAAEGVEVAHGRISWLTAGSTAHLDLTAALPDRGPLTHWTVRVTSRLPFACFEVAKHEILDASLLVLPRPVTPTGLNRLSGPMELHESAPAWLSAGPGDPRGLRGWQPGDAPKRIHWPATMRSLARGAGWLVVETEPPGFRPERFVIILHSVGGSRGLIRPERFERTLSHAAALLRLLHAQAAPARMIADFDHWQSRPATRRDECSNCLEILAHARRASGTEPHELIAALATVRDDEGLVILSDMPVHHWRDFLPNRLKHANTPESEPLRRHPGKEVPA